MLKETVSENPLDANFPYPWYEPWWSDMDGQREKKVPPQETVTSWTISIPHW